MLNNRFLQSAPEGFLSSEQIKEVHGGRRGFMASAFAAAVAAASTASTAARAQSPAAELGDPNILNLPGHTKALGQGVAARGYGVPSVYEKNLQRQIGRAHV